MRPRTKSVVTVREYFRQGDASSSDQEDDADEDHWMQIAMRKAPASSCSHGATIVKFSKTRERTSTLDSWEGTDLEDFLDDDDDDGIERERTCSHDRRISFDDDINIVEIPSRDSFDADYKRRVWYSVAELAHQHE